MSKILPESERGVKRIEGVAAQESYDKCPKCQQYAVHLASHHIHELHGDAEDNCGDESLYHDDEAETEITIGGHICFECNYLVDVFIESPRDKVSRIPYRDGNIHMHIEFPDGEMDYICWKCDERIPEVVKYHMMDKLFVIIKGGSKAVNTWLATYCDTEPATMFTWDCPECKQATVISQVPSGLLEWGDALCEQCKAMAAHVMTVEAEQAGAEASGAVGEGVKS